MPKTILVPVDGSEQSFGALAFATRDYPRSTIVILSIVDISQFTREHEVETSDPERIREIAREQTSKTLDEATARIDGHDGGVQTKTGAGQASRVILDYATDHNIDQIVLGCCGKSFKSDVQLGQVTDAVVRRATIPVTVVHGH